MTLDEMYLSTTDTVGKRDGYYETKRKQTPNEYKKKERSGWPRKILCAMGFCHRGSTSLRIVRENVKVNNEVFLREMLISVWKKDISRLYPDEERKVLLPMNGARAFFHPTVVQWLETSKINTFLQDTGQPTPQICPQWIMELMEFLKIL